MKKNLKAVAVFVLVTFIGTCVHPVAFASLTPTLEAASFPAAILAIPAEFGQVTEIVEGDPLAPAFIHIQSAHGNYSAEKNIENLLGYIEKNSNVHLMLLEGAANKLHPELFRFFPSHPDFNRKVTDQLMREGYLTGPESFLIGSSKRSEGWGIENLEAYKKDLHAFISVAKSDKTVQAFLLKLRASLDKRFSSKLNKDLFSLVRQKETFDLGTLSFEAWLKTLGEASKKHLKQDLLDAFYQDQYPFLVRYFRLQQIGLQIDRQKAQLEADAFLKNLEALKVSKEILGHFKSILQLPDAELLKTSGRTKEGYSTLRRAFDLAFDRLPKDFSMKTWPNWTIYAQYIILMQEMEGKGLQEEVVKLENQIQAVLAQTQDEKAYLSESRNLFLLKRLFSLELTRAEYEDLKSLHGSLEELMAGPETKKSSSSGLSTGEREGMKGLRASADNLQSIFAQAMMFYETAVIREQHMFGNALQKMGESREQRAVIVTGGFHAEGLKKLAAAQGCSYLQIIPRIHEVSKRDHEVYLHSILGPRDIKTSQMSALLGIADSAQRIAVTGRDQARDWFGAIRDLIRGLISSEPVSDRRALDDAFNSFMRVPTPALASVSARSETRDEADKRVSDFSADTAGKGLPQIPTVSGLASHVFPGVLSPRDRDRYKEESTFRYQVEYDEQKRTYVLGPMVIVRQGTKDVNADEEIRRRERLIDVLNILKGYDPKAPSSFTLTVEPNGIRTASPQELIKDVVAGCNMVLRDVMIHPLVFYYATAKRLEVFYHELISHILNGLNDEAVAIKNTRDALFSFAHPWADKKMPQGAASMKIALIDAGSPRAEINEALGIEILAGALKTHFKDEPEVSVKMHDLQLETDTNALLAEIQKSPPDILGIAIKIGTFPLAAKIIDFVLTLPLNKRPIIFLGNTIATFAAKELVDRYPDALIAQGEGEDAISGVARLVLETKRFFGKRAEMEPLKKIILARNIPNLFFRLWETIVITEKKPIDLSHYPLPERETLSEIVRLGGNVNLESSRGCPYGGCSFCVVSGRFRGWRPIPLEKVFRDLERLIEGGAHSVRFIEEDFIGTDLGRAQAIAEGIISRGWNTKIRFAFATRVRAIVDEKRSDVENAEAIATLKLLKKAGLDTVFLGIESGSEDQLMRYRKGATVNENKRAIKVLNDLGINIEPGFIMFDQLMNLKELRENINFLEETGLIYTTSRIMGRLRPQEGSAYKKKLSAVGLLKEDSREINSLTYDARWQNQVIRRIVKIFEEWEGQEKGVADFLQGRLRGNTTTQEREIIEKYLKKLRLLDFKLVKELALAPKRDKELRVQFIGARALLIQKVIDELERLQIYDVRSSFGSDTLEKLGVVSLEELSLKISDRDQVLVEPSVVVDEDWGARPPMDQADEEPRVVIIAGVTGSGKNTLFEPFLEQNARSVSYPPVYTTRSPREGEEAGHYRKFLTEKEFRNIHARGGMVIWSPKHGVFYGLNRQDIVEATRNKKIILIESTGVDSLHKLQAAFPSARSLLILPMSYERMDEVGMESVEKLLLQRIGGRGGITLNELTKRLKEASATLTQFRKERWDGVIVNDAKDRLPEVRAKFTEFVLNGSFDSPALERTSGANETSTAKDPENRSESRSFGTAAIDRTFMADTSSLAAKITTALRVAADTVSPLLSSSAAYAAEIEPVLFAGTVHYQKTPTVPIEFAEKWPVFNRIIRHFADASTARMVIDQRQEVPDAASVLPLVTFARYNPKAAVVLALISDAGDVTAFEKSIAALSPKGALPVNFKIRSFASEGEFVAEFQEFYNSSAPFGRPVVLVTDREQSVITAKIGSRRNLLSVVGGQNSLKQTAAVLLAADKLLEESIWLMGYHFVSIDKLGMLEALMAELTGFIAAQASVAASA